jgi:U3 small nucleolar RNA-associated protein 13
MKLWQLKVIENSEGGATHYGVESVQTVIGHEKDINSIAVAPNDKLIASASQDKTIKVLNIQFANCFNTNKQYWIDMGSH